VDPPEYCSHSLRNEYIVDASIDRMKARSYESPLRAEQAERTRERILDAFAAELGAAGDEFSIPRVAARAGVSTRTVYHYFPNRQSQIEALGAWIERRVGSDPLPQHADDLPAYTVAIYRRFKEHEALLRAQLAPGVAEHVRTSRRRAREKAIEGCVAETGASGHDATLAGALMKTIIGARFGTLLVDNYGLSVDEAARAAAWLARLMVEALRRGEGPADDDRPARRAQRR
jgi:AcrR family transcriptional regulator